MSVCIRHHYQNPRYTLQFHNTKTKKASEHHLTMMELFASWWRCFGRELQVIGSVTLIHV